MDECGESRFVLSVRAACESKKCRSAFRTNELYGIYFISVNPKSRAICIIKFKFLKSYEKENCVISDNFIVTMGLVK